MFIMVVLIVFLGLLIYLCFNAAEEVERDSKVQTLCKELFDGVKSGFDEFGILMKFDLGSFGQSKINLRKNEVVLFSSDMNMSEERVHKYFGGASVRIVKGVRIGGGKAFGVAKMEILDSGLLILTNKRILFFGDRRNFEVKLTDISMFDYDKNYISIGKVGRQKIVQFNNSDSVGQVIGWYIETLMSQDNWVVRKDDDGDSYLALGENLKNEVEGVSGDVNFFSLIAYFSARIISADGEVAEEELDTLNQIISEIESLEDVDTSDLAVRCYEETKGYLKDILEGKDIPFLQEMTEHAKLLSEDVKRLLVKVCTLLAESDGEMSIEERELIDFLNRELMQRYAA